MVCDYRLTILCQIEFEQNDMAQLYEVQKGDEGEETPELKGLLLAGVI